MRYKLIACKVLSRELSYLSAKSDHVIDITYIRQGYHETPDTLRRVLQEEIDSVESGDNRYTNQARHKNAPDIDAILIGYGLCSNGIVGLRSQKYPLVIPRGHDCITFFLGSKERYRDYFESHAGVYWYTRGWLDMGHMPGPGMFDRIRAEYEEKGYDEDTIEYLLENEHSWIPSYHFATYVKMPDFDSSLHMDQTKEAAAGLGWSYDQVDGDLSLLDDFINGRWDDDRFLVVPPGHTVTPSFNEDIIKTDI